MAKFRRYGRRRYIRRSGGCCVITLFVKVLPTAIGLPLIALLRVFRDKVLKPIPIVGIPFINCYYFISRKVCT